MQSFELFDSLAFLLINTAFHKKQGANAMLLKSGCAITVDQYLILEVAGKNEGLTQTALCELTCKNNSNLTRILAGMEKRGLITREKGADARSRTVYLSAQGQQMRREAGALIQAYQSGIAERLTDEEQQALVAILRKIAKGDGE